MGNKRHNNYRPRNATYAKCVSYFFFFLFSLTRSQIVPSLIAHNFKPIWIEMATIMTENKTIYYLSTTQSRSSKSRRMALLAASQPQRARLSHRYIVHYYDYYYYYIHTQAPSSLLLSKNKDIIKHSTRMSVWKTKTWTKNKKEKKITSIYGVVKKDFYASYKQHTGTVTDALLLPSILFQFICVFKWSI